MLYSRLFPRKSPHASHGEPTLEKGMIFQGRCMLHLSLTTIKNKEEIKIVNVSYDALALHSDYVSFGDAAYKQDTVSVP
jgi:hypothetical protein